MGKRLRVVAIVDDDLYGRTPVLVHAVGCSPLLGDKNSGDGKGSLIENKTCSARRHG